MVWYVERRRVNFEVRIVDQMRGVKSLDVGEHMEKLEGKLLTRI